MKSCLALAAVALALALPASAAERPTLRATPLVVGPLGQVVLSGTSRARSVVVEAKECNASFYHVVGAARPSAGTWTYQAAIDATTAYRARSGGAFSRPVTVRRRAVIDLVHREGTRIFVANVHDVGAYIIGRRISLERLTEDGWVLVGRAKLRRHLIFGRVTANFRVLRRGLALRAFLPQSAARPCLVAGASKMIRS